MWKLVPIFIFSMLMAWLSDMRSPYTLGRFGEKKYIRKDIACYGLMTISMAVFVGLRTAYNDTYTYKQMYENLLPGADYASIDKSLGSNPGFWYVNTWLKSIGCSTQTFLMIYALITVVIYLWFVRKYTDDILFAVFLFYTMGVYVFTMAAIKQCVAVAFCLIATDRAIQKKWIPFIIWVGIAMVFHPYAFMYLAVPLLISFNPWTRRSYLVLLGFGAMGVGLQALLGRVIDITSMMGEEYNLGTFTGEGVNVFRLLVIWVPVMLSFFTQKYWRDNEDRVSNAIMNLTMLNAEIMFIALFGTANYFARLANYFLIFQCLALPMLLRYFNQASRQILKWGAVIGYLGYFYYATGIVYGGFDVMFRKITLLQYFMGQ